MQRVLVLSPHPDDETLGCGGALCRHVAGSDRVKVIFLTSGERGGHGADPADTARLREREAARAADILGYTELEFWRAADGALRADAALIDKLGRELMNWSPDLIYTTHPGEAHADHRAAARLLRKALGRTACAAAVRQFEVWTPLSRIDHIVDISEWMATKLQAVRAYRSQCSVLRFDEAVAGLNRYRGEMHSWPGGDYAEVFEEWRR